MKKLLIIFVSLATLVSCFSQKNEEIENAKTELLSGAIESPISEPETIGTKDVVEQTDQLVMIEPDETQTIIIDELDATQIQSEEIVITGKVVSDVERIEVQFSNEMSDFPLDSYTLQSFTPGDTTFKYIASSRQRVLDYGKNTYTFTAYTTTGKAISTISIFLDKTLDSRKEVLEKTGTGGTIIEEDSVVTWLSVKKVELPPMSCDSVDALTEFLLEKYSWAYWNTCRDIEKEKWIYFNVLRLDGESYIYERHYYDYTHWYYGVLTLETGTGVDKDTMGDKNAELKLLDFTWETREATEYFKSLNTVQTND